MGKVSTQLPDQTTVSYLEKQQENCNPQVNPNRNDRLAHIFILLNKKRKNSFPRQSRALPCNHSRRDPQELLFPRAGLLFHLPPCQRGGPSCCTLAHHRELSLGLSAGRGGLQVFPLMQQHLDWDALLGLQSRAACDSLSQNVFQPQPSQCFTCAFLTHLPITLFFLRTELRTKTESKAKWLISTLNWRCWAKHKVSRTPPCTAGESEGWYSESAEAIGKRSIVTPGFHFPSFAGRFTLTSQAVCPGARPLSSFLLRKSPFP